MTAQVMAQAMNTAQVEPVSPLETSKNAPGSGGGLPELAEPHKLAPKDARSLSNLVLRPVDRP